MKKVKVFRYLPGKDSYWQDYQIEVKPEDAILTVLHGLRLQDPTLAYRSSCRSAVCGSCAMVINGRPRLACQTKVRDINGDEIKLSPLPGLKVIKDLITDLEPFWENYRKIMPWLDEKQGGEKIIITNQVSDLMEKMYVCLLCASCYGACPEAGVDQSYLGPAAIMEGYRFVCHPGDAITDKRMEILSGEGGAFACDGAFACIDACPWDVAPIEYVAQVRTEVAKMKLGFGTKHQCGHHKD